MTVAVVGAVGVLAGVTKVSRRAVALARAVVARASARALRLDLPEEAQQVPLASVLRPELLGEIPRELRDPAAGDGIPVERVHRPRGHRVLAIHEDDVRDALRGCGDGEPVPGDGPRRRRVTVRGAETHLGHFPPHRLVERLEVRLAEGDVDVFANQVALRARPERAIRAEERIHAGALAGAAHAINLPGLVVRLADLFRVARAAAGAVVGATHVGAVVVGITRVAPALGREHGRVAEAVALAVVPAPAGVHTELVLESLEDGRESALIIPAGSRGVRGELRRDRIDGLIPVVRNPIRRQHPYGRRFQLAIRGPRPLVRDVQRDRQVVSDVGDDREYAAVRLPRGLVPLGQVDELLPPLCVRRRAPRDRVHQTQQVLAVQRGRYEVHVGKIRGLYEPFDEPQTALLDTKINLVNLVVSGEGARHHPGVIIRLVPLRLPAYGRHGDDHLQVVEPATSERIPRPRRVRQEPAVTVASAGDKLIRDAGAAATRGLPDDVHAASGIFHEILQLHHPPLGVSTHERRQRRAVAFNLQLLRSHRRLQGADQISLLGLEPRRANSLYEYFGLSRVNPGLLKQIGQQRAQRGARGITRGRG